MAIDYGTKRTGIAVSDPLQLIGSGLCTISTPRICDFLKEYIKQEKVDCLVIGEPKDSYNRASSVTPQIEAFIAVLRKQFPALRIEREDERLTSVFARQAIREGGANRKKRQDKSLIDKTSATLILQNFMQRRANISVGKPTGMESGLKIMKDL